MNIFNKIFEHLFAVPQFKKRFLLMLVGIFFMGFFLSLLILVGFGTDPYSFMNLNIARAINLSLGNWQLIFNSALFCLMLLFARSLIGLGTLFNMIFIGYIADFFCYVWTTCGFEAFVFANGLCAKIIVFVLALFGFVVFASFYINAQLGLSPYDATANILSKIFARVPFFVVRIIFDLFAIVIGCIASRFVDGGMVSSAIGGTAMALLLGPAITIVGGILRRTILKIDEPCKAQKTV